MREGSPLRRLTGAFGAALAVGALVFAPAALAQADDPDVDEPEVGDPPEGDPTQEDPTQEDPTEENPGWSDSRFDEPLGSSPAMIRRSSFPISGVFDHSVYEVTAVYVDFRRTSDNSSAPADGAPCVPADPGMVAGPQDEDAEEVRFSVDGVVWPCNGTFAVRATAYGEGSVGGSSEHTMDAVVTLQAPPAPVGSVDAAVDGGTVTITWDGQDPSPDAAGYRLERAGPKSADDSYGSFDDVSSVDAGTTTTQDSPGQTGDYQYRVRALRSSGGGLESPLEGTAVTDVSIGSTTTSPTSNSSAIGAGSGSRRSTLGAPRSNGTPRLPSSPPATIDTGFSQEIDYGDRPLDDELASEGGQSIIRTEGDGAGLIAPAAGALVLLGWAGHIVYLNRLAKQF